MPTFAVIHNIPSPYRLHLFRVLSERLRLREIDFHVHFMATGHLDRPHWKVAPEQLTFPHTFWPDIGPTFRQKEWHLNPSMLGMLATTSADYLLLGGPWDSLTGMFTSLLARRRVGIAWYESNTHTPGRITGWVAAAKRTLLRRFDYFAVPGEEGVRHVEMLFADPLVRRRCVFLPNIIDETRFAPGWVPESGKTREQVRSEWGVDDKKRLSIWPARLIPDKGIIEFLEYCTPNLLDGWRILLVGEGPLQTQIRTTIARRQLESFVILQPQVPYEQMPALYNASDLFLLPSIRDSNPLSVIEALHSGLPLLVSSRVGNFPEAIEEGINGWAFDPANSDAAQHAISQAFATDKATLSSMGVRSQTKAKAFWASHQAVDRFLDTIV